MKITHHNKPLSLACLLVALAAACAPCPDARAAEPEDSSVFVNLVSTANGWGTLDRPPEAMGIAPPGNGWVYSAAATVSGTTWNRVYKPTATPATGTFPEESPFVFNTLNHAPLYTASGTLSSMRLHAELIGTVSREEPGHVNNTPLNVKDLLNSCWRIYAGDTAAYVRFTFSGLAQNAHYLLYCYANTNGANQGGRYVLHPSYVPVGRASATYMYPGTEIYTEYLDLAGFQSSLSLLKTDSNGKNIIVPPAAINTDAVSDSNTLWGAMHALSSTTGEIVFRTATSKLNSRFYTGFQLVPYPKPTVVTQPPATKVAVLNYNATIKVIARDLLHFSDADQSPLSYQWQVSQDGANWTDLAETAPFSDVNKATLRITGAQFSHMAKYRAKITNVAGLTVYSNASTLSVINQPDPLVITQQPQSRVVVAGDNVALAVGVAGTPQFTYVWQKSDTMDFPALDQFPDYESMGDAEMEQFMLDKQVVGTDTPTLAIPNAQKADTGNYRVTIYDVTQENNVVSNVVQLYVEYAKPIITPPGKQTVVPGNSIRLFGNVYDETGSVTYQWQMSADNGTTWQNITDGGAYAGATTETLHIANAATGQAGLYRLIANNAVTTAHGAEGGATNGASISLAVAAPLVAHPVSVAADKAGHLYVTDDSTNTLYRYTLASGTAVLFGGQAGSAGHADGYYAQATFNGLSGVVAGAANTAYIADTLNHSIRYTLANGSVNTIAGSASVSDNIDGTGTTAAFNSPVSVAYDAAGNIYVADNAAHTIRRITPVNFDVTTLAGVAGSPGSANGATTDSNYNPASRFTAPGAIAVSPINLTATGTGAPELATSNTTTIYVADTGNNIIRRIMLTWYLDRDPVTNIQTRTRIQKNDVITLAGASGTAGYANGIGAQARFNAPAGLAVDSAGTLYVADTGNNTIRKITITSGTANVTTLAGLSTVSGYQDGPDGDNALFNQPRGVSVDLAGNVYVADTGNAAVRMISPEGKVSTLVFKQGPTPVAINTGTGGTGASGTTVFEPAGSGDGGGDMGGGAPSLWFLGALALLGLGRIASAQKFFMKIKNLLCVFVAAIAGCAIASSDARADAAPAVFVKLHRDQSSSAGVTLTTSATIAIPVQGSGWDYSGAAPYSGTVWNKILRPNAADMINAGIAGGANEGTLGSYNIKTANNIALFSPDGTDSGVKLTVKVNINALNGTRQEPNAGYISGYNNTLMPSTIANDVWRLIIGDNTFTFTFSNLPASKYYLLYLYGALDNGNARFDLAPANIVRTEASWLGIKATSQAGTHVFAVGSDSKIAPVPAAPPNDGTKVTDKPWGVLPVLTDAAGQLIFSGTKFDGNTYVAGFQLIPHPVAHIATQPEAGATVSAGGNITLTVVAAGFDASDTLSYQWRKGGVNIDTASNASAATASLTLIGVPLGDDNSTYDVVITNYGGSVTSTATTLTVTSGAVAPDIVTAPAAQTASVNGSVTFSVSANGTSPLTYTWQKSTTGTADGDFTDIPSSNSAVLPLTGITTADAGYYRVKIANGTLPDATSGAVTLIVAPVITTPPVGAVVVAGSSKTLSVTADTGIATAPFAPAYVWKRNGTAVTDDAGSGISGATTAALSFANFAAAQSGNYTVTVTNAAGSVTSDTIYVGTPAAMTATQWPANGASAVNPDTPLKLTFTGGTPVLGTTGKVLIRDAADDSIVETIDLSTLLTLDSGNRPGYAIKTIQGMQIYYQPVAIYGNEVWITHTSGAALAYNKTYYVTIEPGVLFDQLGATYPGIADNTSWRFTTRAAAPDISSRTIVVAADGTGDYTTVQAALDKVPANNTSATPYVISLAPGTYRERLTLRENRKFVTVKGAGASRNDTVISHGWCNTPTSGEKSAVFMLYTDDLRVENLTVENTAGATAGQQLALFTNNARQVVDNVLMKGWQDTLAVWGGTAYFRDCEVWGSVDFVYAGGTGYFDHCDIIQIRDTGGPVSAPSTDFANPYGLIFNNCRLLKGRISTGHPMDVAADSSTLMRPWYEDGMSAFINCQLDDHISLKGWGEWSSKENTCRAREYGSTLIADGSAVSVAARQAAGAYWLNTIDPDYTSTSIVETDPLVSGAGTANRQPVTVNPDDYTIEAVFGNTTFYNLGTWRPTVAPRIVKQPVAQSLNAGQTLTLTAEVFGLPSASIQWYCGGTPVPGATSATLTLTNAQAANAGSYYVTVTNALGSVSTTPVAVTVTPASLPTGSLKVDINRDSNNTAVVTETGYTRWSEDATNGAAAGTAALTRTFTTKLSDTEDGGNVTISFSQTALSETRGGTGLLTNWYKAGAEGATGKLVSDGLAVAPANLATGGQLQMTVTGLSAGTHTLVTYHNAWDNITAGTLGPINIDVNGTRAITGLQPTIRAATTAAAASAFLTFTVTGPTDVVTILFSGDDTAASPVAIRNPMINGFELNTADVTRIAHTPAPANYDEHVNADAGSATLSWLAALSGDTASHNVYFGASRAAVEAATTASPEYKGNQTALSWNATGLNPHATYYWRIDEVNTSSAVTKGTVWMFRARHLAFPDAEGYGRFARGGRGGKVVHVTSLADYTSGDTPVPGTLRYAVEQETGPRTIVFDVGGLITLESRLTVNSSYITIAGQTAPGKGITLRKYTMGLSGAKDVIVRYIRSRPGNISGTTIDGMGMAGSDHAIMDHCSISWSIDEAFSSRSAKNITLQRTLISEALNAAGHQNYPAGTEHGYAASIGGDIGSFHHNLLAHNYGRNWSLAGGLDANGYFAGRLEITNNVVYNWGGRTTDGGAMEVNFVNNYYKPGAGTTHFYALTMNHENDFAGSQRAYFAGNVMPGYFNEATQDTGRRSVVSSGVPTPTYETFVTTPFYPSNVTTQTAGDAYKRVISDVGANLPLDDHDARIVQETISGTFAYRGSVTNKPGFPDTQADVGGWEDYPTVAREAGWDSDGDGLPDWWETIKGTNPNSAAGDFSDANADTDADGYTNLDDYLNWIATPNVTVAANATAQIDLSKLTRGYTATPAHTVSGAQNGSVILESDGKTATFTPTAAGLAKFTYTVTDAQSSTMTGAINIRVTAVGAATGPEITTQPSATTAIAGSPVTLSVVASGAGLSYQWYHNDTAITGATAATLMIANPQSADAGSYYVVVTNAQGNTTSSTITLTVATPPAVFVKIAAAQATAAGAKPAAAGTITIAPQGSGWDYSAAAVYSGTIWNNIQRPHNSDLINSNSTGSNGTFRLITADGIALVSPDGTASGVTLAADMVIADRDSNTTRTEPNPYTGGAVGALGPLGLMDTGWRIYRGGNSTIFTFAGLPADAHYLVYCYASTTSAGQGSKFILGNDNLITSGTMWLATHGAATGQVFADTAGVIAPIAAAPVKVDSNTGANINTTWGVFHAKVDTAGKLTVSTAKNNQNGQYIDGFQLIPYPKAAITTQPSASEAITEGDNITLTVVAAGFDAEDTLTYQWRKGGVPISIATNATAGTASLTITGALTTDAGSYDVVVTNYGGGTISTACALTVGSSGPTAAPAITAQPVSNVTAAGASVTLSVAASGGGLSYQWYRNGAAISGATDATLTIANPQASDAGNYHVVVTNTLGDATSTDVTLTVESATPAPAVFVTLLTTQAALGAAPTVSATQAITAPGNGWNYSAAAPYAGETWNTILAPHNDDRVVPTIKGYVRYQIVPYNTANNIAVFAPDGSDSGVTLTMSAILDDQNTATNAREVPRLVNATNMTPALLLGGNWRIYEGGNFIGFALKNLPANAHYIVYGYAGTNGAGQGARFILDAANNLETSGTMFFHTNPAALTNPTLFDTSGATTAPIAPVPVKTAQSAATLGTLWGSFHAKADATGNLGFRVAGGGFVAGFQVMPYPKATITTDLPATASVAGGDTTTLTIVAAGFGAGDVLTYQWRKGGVPINTAANATANTAALVISAAQSTDAGDYDVVVTNYGGSVISGVCTLSVTAGTGAPAIFTAPLAQTGTVGGNASFSVSAGGQPPLAYVWQKSTTGTADADFSEIDGATTSALALSGLTTANAGYYRVKITNPLEATGVFSTPVTLIVAPVITTQPASAVISIGAPATLTVAADTGIATAPFAPTYQWKFNGSPITDGAGISGATTATLSIASFAIADAGSYTVTVSNGAGSATSNAAVLGNPVMPVIVTQPAASQTTVAGLAVSFVASATGVPSPTYQWNHNGTPITSATNATYTIAATALADTGTYTVVATNMAGYATSNPAVLTVRDPAGSAVTRDGFGAAATGGAGGATYVVTTPADLSAKLALAEAAIITVSGTIDVRGLYGKRVDVTSNKTLQGADASATIVGNVNINGVNNVIVRGLNVTNPGTTPSATEFPRYEDGGDGVTIQNATNILVTHCTFYDCADGMCDMTYACNNITVSWNKFYYTTAQANHRFTMILGNQEVMTDHIHATLHHNWWAERCDQRMPASTYAMGHMFNNYFTCANNSYSNNARNNTQLFIEKSYFGTGVKNPVGVSDGSSGLIRTIDNIYYQTTGTYDAGLSHVFTPSYSYQLDDTANVPTLIPQYAGNVDGAFSVTPAAAAPLAVVASSTLPFQGDTVTLVPSVGSAGTAYQWRLNNFDVPGATSETLTLANINASKLGIYTVVVTTAPGKFTVSSPVTLAFGAAPSFTAATGGALSAVTGRSVTISPPVLGAGATYQWQQYVGGAWVNVANGANYAGATSRSLTIQNAGAAQSGQYRLVVTNPSGSATTDPYTLSLTPVLFPRPSGIAVDAYGDVFVADSAANVIRKVTSAGVATLYAGIPNTAGSYDGAFGLNTFNAPSALAIDAFGNIYVADTGNAIIRRISRDGSVETLVGDPTKRGNRDAIGTAALLTSPNGIAFDRTNGVTYFADTNINTIRKMVPIALQSGLFAGNTVATIGGVGGSTGYDDVLVISGSAQGDPAKFDHPGAVAYTTGSFAYVADTGNSTIRKIVIASGTFLNTVTTLAGTPGVVGGDDGSGVAALFNHPEGIVMDYAGGNIYVADTKNHTIRKVTSAGAVTTIAGQTGVSGYADGLGAAALFNNPAAITIDVSGSHLYIADTGNAAIRKITMGGAVATVATMVVNSANDTLPLSGTTTPFTPTVDPHANGGSGGGGGGAPSHWFFGALAALVIVRFVRRRKA